ncbi:hypothetical protein HanPSC8_Chr13g0559211 [Helianthus annuus]|nr:hypothetical protein HanPSC8_Chr13g0559211 [Helianthus annuus]
MMIKNVWWIDNITPHNNGCKQNMVRKLLKTHKNDSFTTIKTRPKTPFTPSGRSGNEQCWAGAVTSDADKE